MWSSINQSGAILQKEAIRTQFVSFEPALLKPFDPTEGSRLNIYRHILPRQPAPRKSFRGWSYSANGADKRSAQTTRIGGLLAGASYDMHQPRWHTFSAGPQHRRLSDRGDA